jgi:tRNA modification GTPase
MTEVEDTIVAPATPPGVGGIGVLRISGALTEQIARTMLGSLPEPRAATYCTFRDREGRQVDQGIALYFPAPGSFTGESILELQGHGGTMLMSMLVDAAVGLGARRAQPGEFSKRAFLNGKLDLAQAEAIADLVSSGTAQAARAALSALNGQFSDAVNALAGQLTALRTYVEAAIDFPEEEIDFLSDDALAQRISDCGRSFESLLAGASTGRILRDGFRVVIVGKPNAGKSSLLNRLSGEDTAIVTEIAGTTRDVLRESINIDGLLVEFVDTAGIRENPDRIEEEGIRRARAAIANADAVLWIQDATDLDEAVLDDDVPEGVPVTIVRNKIDLTGDSAGIRNGDEPIVMISAATGEGIDVLRSHVRALAGVGNLGEGAFTARRRHVEALEAAAAHFGAGHRALQENRAGELLAEELRLAQQALGEITGAVAPDELLSRIFSEFCIGK